MNERPPVSAQPLFTNPHIRMCSVITGVIQRWQEDGHQLLRHTYRRLGRRTGRHMIAAGVVPRDADIETYGRVSEQIMDLNGLGGYTRLDTGKQEHALDVPNCARYTEAYRFLGAPTYLCSIPFEWDNGCLDSINPALQIWPGPCVYRGDARCVYRLDKRDSSKTEQTLADIARDDPAPSGVGSTDAGGTSIANAPDWTNPQVGLYAILSAVCNRYGEEGRRVARQSLYDLGLRSGQFLLDQGVVRAGCTPAEWGEVAADLAEVSGFYDHRSVGISEDCFELHLTRYPYLEPFTFFGAPHDILDIGIAWERGCLKTINPELTVSVPRCIWRGDDVGIIRVEQEP